MFDDPAETHRAQPLVLWSLLRLVLPFPIWHNAFPPTPLWSQVRYEVQGPWTWTLLSGREGSALTLVADYETKGHTDSA